MLSLHAKATELTMLFRWTCGSMAALSMSVRLDDLQTAIYVNVNSSRCE